jgi:DNA-binding MarR family transcriptional regulator
MSDDQPQRRDNTAHLISAARRAINQFLVDAMRSHDMGTFAPSHGDIVAVLLYSGATTMTALAERINRDRSTVTTLVQRLSDEGYVTFRDNPDDARSRLVYLTEKGLNLQATFETISSELAATLWDGVDTAARALFRDTLRQIIHNFESSSLYDG